MAVDGLVLAGAAAAGLVVGCLTWLTTGDGPVARWPDRRHPMSAGPGGPPTGPLTALSDRFARLRAPAVAPGHESLVRFLDHLLWADRQGLPLAQGVVTAARRSRPVMEPVADHIEAALRTGTPLGEALQDAAERSPGDAARLLRLLAVATEESHAGSAATRQLLEGMRGRVKLETEIQSELARELAGLQANTRVVTLAIPALVLLAWVTNPSLLRPLVADPTGRVLGMLALVIFGGMLLVLRRLTRLEV